MNEIVEYHNDFNKLSLGNFNELEQNLLMGILYNVKNKGDLEVRMDFQDVMSCVHKRKNITKKELLELVLNLRNNFFKLDFKVIKRQGTLKAEVYYNLFSKFEIWVDEIENLERQILENEFSHLILKVNPDFLYIVNQLTEKYTQYELEEFLYLRGKYAKNLYRLLKQFRTSGEYYATWQDFKDKMGIPSSFSNEKIETLILKPCVEKLSETIKTNLFDARIPFKNLEYKLKKEKSHRGKPQVTHIIFKFNPQEASCLDERQKSKNLENSKKIVADPQDPRYITDLKKLIASLAPLEKIEIKNDIYMLRKVYFHDNAWWLDCQKNGCDIAEKLSYETAKKFLKS